MNELCKGCLTQIYNYEEEGIEDIACESSEFNNINYECGICPCTNCIVKIMCDEACGSFDLWQFMIDTTGSSNQEKVTS